MPFPIYRSLCLCLFTYIQVNWNVYPNSYTFWRGRYIRTGCNIHSAISYTYIGTPHLSLIHSLSPFSLANSLSLSHSLCDKNKIVEKLKTSYRWKMKNDVETRIIISPFDITELTTSVTSKKLPNVYKSCLKMISLEKWKILTPFQKFDKNVPIWAK